MHRNVDAYNLEVFHDQNKALVLDEDPLDVDR